MADPLHTVAATLREAFARATGLPADDIDPVVRPSDRADAQANGALALAKQVGKNPREVADAVVATGLLAEVCSAVEVAGPGFINLTFTPEFLAGQLAAAGTDAHLGVRPAVAEVAVVDYSAPNVAKEMHVGHLRTTIIGDALVRLLTFAGHTVVRENHVGDWGLQFGMLIEHLVDIGEASAAAELSTGDLTAFYRQAKTSFDDDDAFKERARQRVVLLQAGDPETRRLWHVLVDQSDAYFQQVYDRLGVLLRPEDTRGESAYNDMLPVVVDDLAAAGLLVESDGAMCVFPPGFTGRDGQPQPLIVKNRNGGFGYAATDLATVRDRVDRLGATWLIYVVGAPQAQHLAMVWKTCEQAGWLAPPARAVHVPFGSVLGEDRKMYRTRSGDSVKLSDLLDEAVEQAAAKIAEANPSIVGDERARVSRAVGIGAVKYADLSNDRIKDYVFSFERMLAFEGNTGPYIQYAHARISKILRDAGDDAADLAGVVPALAEPQERALAKALVGFDAAVHDTIDKLGPHRLCTYLFDLAQTFTSFYEACPVLKAGVPEPVRRSRLALCAVTQRVLASSLALLGLEAPARM